MTLRRFMVLVRGLGPNSATTTHLTSRRYIGHGTGSARMSRSPQESENALAALMGRAPAKVH